jgi:hypothetical protein
MARCDGCLHVSPKSSRQANPLHPPRTAWRLFFIPTNISTNMPTPRRLRVVKEPPEPATLHAPPILDAYGTEEFSCGGCGTIFLIANEDQLHGIFIQCAQCGVTNSTDA